ncbi:5'-3' exoribonuclease 2 -like protein [Babesia sp. Xinjiang]|uniref:5'-3' exoribonuclease 2 -like protein n=1 Tax=Babesia sp. Xinjiang TaxID=462227 RepID=UPI000A2239C6|nr:5'-3' exoribonuclease 2 -like protein [Babesia sp. Xinjiang]ORM41410.1 5'-3' exoribonuclease 2 -like protein [Babesia sp. Xinjiang]
MGVPTFYRWLCSRYPRVVQDVKDDLNENDVDFSDIEAFGLALLNPNPNGESDNLYVDMNGLIHPCCHPEGMEQPPSEEVMFQCVFDYIDRLFYLVRPRKLLYLAIDGVAPRAKMNQQRSRRFKSAAEADLEAETYAKVAAEFAAQNVTVPPKETRWDSNVITPGTPFMDELSKRVVAFIEERRQLFEAWARIHVIYSDANAPGEGEHKIMNFVRNQRHSEHHDPNTRHVLHGMDADLIMLGLATHEVNFYIIREIVNHLNPAKKTEEETRKAIMAAQDKLVTGTKLRDDKSYRSMLRQNWKPLQFLRLPVLREYLSHQLYFPSGWSDGKGAIDFERCIDDLVLMCFFCGNDFLPHLPSISITSGSIDQMILLYQTMLPDLGNYLTNEGEINFNELGKFVSYIAQIEDQVFRAEQDFKQRQKSRRIQYEAQNATNKDTNNRKMNQAQHAEQQPTNSETGDNGNVSTDTGAVAVVNGATQCNDAEPSTTSLDVQAEFKKRCSELLKRLREVDDPVEPIDLSLNDSSLWKAAYYRQKFGLSESDDVWAFASEVAEQYIKGMCWVLRYYYQGCVSWGWYYPYHYAPFCSDLKFEGLEFTFEYGNPFTPFQQLMSVMPIRSSHCLPEQLRGLMTDSGSPISNFYPIKFVEDPNGKRYKYQWVALLPFIDERKLLDLVKPIEASLPPNLQERNRVKKDMLFPAPKGKDTLIGEISVVGTHCEFESRSGSKHRSHLLAGAVVPTNVLSIQDLMEDGRTRGFNCETAKRMISNVLGRGPNTDCKDNDVLRNNARDFHQEHNRYSTQHFPGASNGSRNYANREPYGSQYPPAGGSSSYHGSVRRPNHGTHAYQGKDSHTNNGADGGNYRAGGRSYGPQRQQYDYHNRSGGNHRNGGGSAPGRQGYSNDDRVRPHHGSMRYPQSRTHGTVNDVHGESRTTPNRHHTRPYREPSRSGHEGTRPYEPRSREYGAASGMRPDYMAGHKLERPPPPPSHTVSNVRRVPPPPDAHEPSLMRAQKRIHDGLEPTPLPRRLPPRKRQ